MKSVFKFLFLLAAVLHLLPSCSDKEELRPNILLIMVDDLGYSDLGSYGGEIRTPNIDELAEGGLRFTQFYNTAKCHSSRISLLTGLYPSQAGDQSLSNATTLAEVLGEAGYFCSMAGKWHLDLEPTDFGFERYWGHLSGATDFFLGDTTFRYNGEPWNEFRDDFYTTDANLDFTMEFLDEARESGKPFFHYIAFNAPHYPLQAPKEDIEKYLGQYDLGWDLVRQQRFERLKELGIVYASDSLPPLPDHMTPWEELSPSEQEFESMRMSVYAAMVDRLDQNIGRLLAYLEKHELRENTLIMLVSDNGACPFERSRNLDIPPWEGGSFLLYDASWATVCNTPLRHYKQTQHEGGISTPFIVNWPGQLKESGSWDRKPAHLVDVMATCLDIAGADYPEREGLQALQGISLLPAFRGEERDIHETLYFRFSSCRALRQGDWKLVSFYRNPWELYKISDDRFEQNDLAETYPEIVEELSELWFEMAEYTDLLPPDQLKELHDVPRPVNHHEWHRPELLYR